MCVPEDTGLLSEELLGVSTEQLSFHVRSNELQSRRGPTRDADRSLEGALRLLRERQESLRHTERGRRLYRYGMEADRARRDARRLRRLPRQLFGGESRDLLLRRGRRGIRLGGHPESRRDQILWHDHVSGGGERRIHAGSEREIRRGRRALCVQRTKK